MPNWTKDQLDAITVQGGTVLVSAAAGSGKTAVLVERILRKITDPVSPVDADRFLIVTFTRAAAAGMRRKLLSGLKDLLKQDPYNSRLQRQLTLLDKAKICTIDSFFSTVVRENFEVLGISPNLRIVDDAFIAAKSDRIMEELMEEHYLHPTEEFAALVRYFGEEKDDALRAEIRNIYKKLRSIPHREKWLEEQLSLYKNAALEDAPWLEPVFRKGREYLHAVCHAIRLENDAARLNEAVLKGYGKALAADAEAAALAESLCRDDLNMMAKIFQQVFTFPTIGRVSKEADVLVQNQVKELRETAKDAAKKGKELFDLTEQQARDELQKQSSLIETLFSLVREYESRLKADKLLENYGDFDDFAEMTYALLLNDDGSPTERAGELASRFDEILIDEYQDTNFLQDDIFRAVSQNGENLFFVGDLKQSIYKFRNAAPRVFSEKKERYHRRSEGGFPAVISLSKNFRSRDKVVDGINFFFEKLMSKALGAVDYGEDDRLYCGAEYYPPTGQKYAVEVTAGSIADGEDEEKTAVLEAAAVAARVKELLEEGYPVTEGSMLRPCRASDFVILLRSAKGVDRIYAEALKTAGVDAVTGASNGYFDSREVSVMLDLLRVIDDPVADLSMAAVLLSPLSVFTADDLSALILSHPADSLYSALLKEERQGNEKAAEFLSFLQNLRQKSAVYSIRRLIQYIYDTTDFLEVIAGFSKNGLRQANLKLLLKYAGDYEQTGSRELRPFLSYLEKLMELDKDLEVANPHTEEQAVTVMTIHHSKGLEYPIVILAGCSKQFNKMDLRRTTAMDMFAGYGMKYIDRDSLQSYDTLPLKGVRLAQEQELLSEEMRLLYVAMTRAKERLCIFLTEKDLGQKLEVLHNAVSAGGVMLQSKLENAASYADWLLLALLQSGAGEALCRRYGLTALSVEDAPVEFRFAASRQPTEEKAAEEENADPALVLQIEKNLGYAYPHLQDTVTPVKLSVTEITHTDRDLSLSLPRFAMEQGFTPAQKGTIFHRCMQFADFENGSTDPMAELLRLQSAGYLTAAEAETVDLALWQKFFASELLGRILSSPRVLREYSFFDSLPARDAGYEGDSTILIQGIADCLFEEDGAGVIVDFKTDRVTSPKTLLDRYREQLLLYKKALAPLFPKGIKECVIYSVALGTAITV